MNLNYYMVLDYCRLGNECILRPQKFIEKQNECLTMVILQLKSQ